MKRYAQVSNGVVVAITFANEMPETEFIIDVTEVTAELGWLYSDGGFSEPTPSAQAQNMKMTKLGFKQRFTQPERIAIRQAAASNPVVFDFQDLLDSATYIDISRQDTIDAINQLEQFGLIGEGRAEEILSPPVLEIEQYNS